ncbi:hypothetical protein FCM35_KLT14503 [Carex littledalei]|uniref:Uncharacterized protein n=1 Tax=Carex littledalei TaxID=544730 RepID=A0A833Q8L9_9POAL|nr:hypothetical protein FCM35_KLT14503 [Carex littledalei]
MIKILSLLQTPLLRLELAEDGSDDSGLVAATATLLISTWQVFHVPGTSTKESNCNNELERKRHTYVCLANGEEEEEEAAAEEEAGERLLRNIMYPRGNTTPAIMIATPIRYLPGVGGSISMFYLVTTGLRQIRSAVFHVRVNGEGLVSS